MCKWGDLEEVNVTIPAELSSTGKEKKKSAKVDKCISGLVDALNRAGIKTRTSCCGHGKTLGHIILTDGRELFIAPSYPIGRVVDMFMKNVDTEMAKINYEKEYCPFVDNPDLCKKQEPSFCNKYDEADGRCFKCHEKQVKQREAP